uniref:HTH iclR-type domain-containing protein n=1 Tax=Rhabditophanes sp. KR3021 TaxID=114890 RepID=A0AC35UA16_9BILA
MMKSMAVEAQESRRANAKVVMCEGELLASYALVDAANVMAQNTISVYLRYLQTLGHVAQVKNRTIVVPYPMDLVRIFLARMKKKKDSHGKKNDGPGFDMSPIVVPNQVADQLKASLINMRNIV